jgi:hypothetical protein
LPKTSKIYSKLEANFTDLFLSFKNYNKNVYEESYLSINLGGREVKHKQFEYNVK